MTDTMRFGYPTEKDYIESLECILGWIIGKAAQSDLDISLVHEILLDDTAIDVTTEWARHLMAQVRHPDD